MNIVLISYLLLGVAQAQSDKFKVWISSENGKSYFNYQKLDLDPAVWSPVSYDEKCELRHFKKGTKLYHWAPDEDIKLVLERGKITDLDYGSSQNQSNFTVPLGEQGYYMSSDIWDSKGYGNRLIVDILEEDIDLVDSITCQMADHPNSHTDERELYRLRGLIGPEKFRALGIMGGMENGSNSKTYMTVFDQRASSVLREATIDDFLCDEGLSAKGLTLSDFVLLNSRYPIPKGNAWLIKNYPEIADKFK